MMLDFRTDPILRDGMAVRATIVRKLLLPGPARRRAEAKARKRYLAEHPEER